MRIALRGDRVLDEALFGLAISIAAALETVSPGSELLVAALQSRRRARCGRRRELRTR